MNQNNKKFKNIIFFKTPASRCSPVPARKRPGLNCLEFSGPKTSVKTKEKYLNCMAIATCPIIVREEAIEHYKESERENLKRVYEMKLKELD